MSWTAAGERQAQQWAEECDVAGDEQEAREKQLRRRSQALKFGILCFTALMAAVSNFPEHDQDWVKVTQQVLSLVLTVATGWAAAAGYEKEQAKAAWRSKQAESLADQILTALALPADQREPMEVALRKWAAAKKDALKGTPSDAEPPQQAALRDLQAARTSARALASARQPPAEPADTESPTVPVGETQF